MQAQHRAGVVADQRRARREAGPAHALGKVPVELGQSQFGFGLAIATRDVTEDLASQVPELVQRARDRDAVEEKGGDRRADVEEGFGESGKNR